MSHRFQKLSDLVDAVRFGQVKRTHLEVTVDNDHAEARLYKVPVKDADDDDYVASEVVWRVDGDPSLALIEYLCDIGVGAHGAVTRRDVRRGP